MRFRLADTPKMRGAFHLIRSSAFPIEPGEDANTNPGVFGLSLANYLAAQMRLRGWSVESPRSEDFGYCIMLARKPFRLWIGCGNTGDRTDEWSAFAAAEGAFLKRTLGVVDPTVGGDINPRNFGVERRIVCERRRIAGGDGGAGVAEAQKGVSSVAGLGEGGGQEGSS
jgi:hypothetical protein